MNGRRTASIVCLLLIAAFVLGASPLYGNQPVGGSARGSGGGDTSVRTPEAVAGTKRVTPADRKAAAAGAAQAGLQTGAGAKSGLLPTPGGTPDYFGPYPNYANSPLPTVVSATSTPTFYFAEGTCRPNFDAYLCIMNPGAVDAAVKITYMKGDGTTATEQLTVPKNSRSTVSPKVTLGTGDDAAHDFSAKVECTNGQQIVAERPMYFNYNGWTGASDAVGATSPEKTFYFAEGTCRPNFDAYLCIQNPGGSDAAVTITYMKGDGTTATEQLTVPKNTRSTVMPRTVLGTGDDVAHDFSAKVECTNGQTIIAERPMYMNYYGWPGGHDAVGATAPQTAWYFAEGTCRPNFDPFICVQNTDTATADVRITYMLGDGTMATQDLTVAANSRSTTSPKDKIGTGDDAGHDFSAKVECTNGRKIVVERPMYFNYNGWTGASDAMGATSPQSTVFFAEGTTRTNFDPYICIQNPGNVDADVTITYMKGDGTTATSQVPVTKNTRVTVSPKGAIGTGDDPAHDFSAKVECTNGQQIIAERPMYMNYNGWPGGHDAVGFAFSTQTSVVAGTGIRKFVDSLPGLGAAAANDLGQYIPVAIPDKTTYPGSDYYEIELGQYTETMHRDLPATKLRGYRQTNTADPSTSKFSYLGPLIVAQRNVPVRVKFTNKLPTGTGGNLFIPVDPSVMGAGMGPDGTNSYKQNRAVLHLHGGITPWISDGTMHQWTTPAGEVTPYPEGVAVQNVPDMPAPGPGSLTFFYTNEQSARLMFYHDHAYGITRLNVYAGEAAGYLLQDTAEKALVDSNVIPADQIPLIIQDKTFVPDDAQLAAQDPTWDKAKYGGRGNLWFPHVYMPNQNPYDPTGMNPMGRWDYGPWFWPPFTSLVNGPVANPYYNPTAAPWEPPVIPGTPNPSIVPEAFMDTPVVNGTAYPFVQVGPKAYRFRILNACNDRYLNLQLYFAKSNGTMWEPASGALLDGNAGEVNMVPATPNSGLPASWPTDGRDGGVPDPLAVGPNMIQIGTEGGFLPQVAELPNTPVGYEYFRRSITVLNVSNKTLFLGPAERADVIVDFSKVPDGAKLILYNDAPAPVPGFDPRLDYYTGDPDQTATGGAPTTVAGYGPNTRTVMQFQVSSSTPGGMSGFDLNTLKARLPGTYAQSQPKPLVPQAAYNAAFGTSYPADAYARIQDTSMSFFNGPLQGIAVTSPGSGYSSPPNVGISGGGGTAAAATANVSGVTNVAMTAGGAGYTTTPGVTFTGGGGSGASAVAQISGVTLVAVATPGAGYTAPPEVQFTGGVGSGATGDVTVGGGLVTGVNITNGGAGYTTAPSLQFIGGGGSGAAGTATVMGGAVTGVVMTSGGAGYTSTPTVNFITLQPTQATAVATVANGSVTGVTVTNGGSGYTSAPTISLVGGNGTGAAATATIQPGAVTGVIVTNSGSGYGPLAPAVGFTGGGGAAAGATATIQPGAVTGITLTNAGSGYGSAPTVTLTGGGGSNARAAAVPVTIDMKPKSIIEDFDPQYGRMNAMLGVEVPRTSANVQTSIPYFDIDPPTEVMKNSVTATPVGSLGDGTEIWKITHNGVDTHAMHWHMFNVQVINRVGWDGAVKPPDPNEIGWKETVRMNPLEDIIVAVRPITPTVPFTLPSSIRPMNPVMPVGDTTGFHNIDPTNQPAPASNQWIDYGWEYVWHCHLLGHEENIMMRSMGIAVAPTAPSALSGVGSGGPPQVVLTWNDNANNETDWIIQRADSATGPWTTVGDIASSTMGTTGSTATYTDTTVAALTTYYYRVVAGNVVGDRQTYTAPAVGYPTMSEVSGVSNTATVPVP